MSNTHALCIIDKLIFFPLRQEAHSPRNVSILQFHLQQQNEGGRLRVHFLIGEDLR